MNALNADGATVVGTVSWNVPVHALVPGAMDRRYDVVFLLVKQTQNETAFAQLGPHLHARSIVCTLQNGIRSVRRGSVRLATGHGGRAVTWAGTFLSPGRVESTADPQKWRAALGALDGRSTHAAGGVREILSVMRPTDFVVDLAGFRWGKLLVNASFSGMSAALGWTFGRDTGQREGSHMRPVHREGVHTRRRCSGCGVGADMARRVFRAFDGLPHRTGEARHARDLR